MIDKLFETINQEFKAQGTKYQVLPNFGICCRELGGIKVTSSCACMRSFCSVMQNIVCIFDRWSLARKNSEISVMLIPHSFAMDHRDMAADERK